jgi:hypothetical protein
LVENDVRSNGSRLHTHEYTPSETHEHGLPHEPDAGC